MEFTKETITSISDEIEVMLKALTEKYGIEVTVPSVTYGKFSATVKLELAVLPDETCNPYKEEWELYFKANPSLPLKPEHFGATFRCGDDAYRIIKVDRTAKKYNVVAENMSTHKEFRFSDKDVAKALNLFTEEELRREFDLKVKLAGLQDRVAYKDVIIFNGVRYTVEDINPSSSFPVIAAKCGNSGDLFSFASNVLPHKNA